MKNTCFSVAVLAALCASPVFAGPALQSSASLSGLGFRLTDLTPNDGIDAQAGIMPSEYGGYSTLLLGQTLRNGELLSDGSQYTDGSVLENTSGSASSLGTTASKDGQGGTATASMAADEVLGILGSVNGGVLGSDTTLRDSGLMSLGEIRVFVGAHTSITFFGQVQVGAQVDASALIDRLALQQLLLAGQGIALEAGARVVLMHTDVNDTSAEGQVSSIVSSTRRVAFDPITGQTLSDGRTGSESIELTISNDSDQDIRRDLWVSLVAETSVSINGLPVVPEPGTWALMGLGLVGLAWVRRHKAEAKAQPA